MIEVVVDRGSVTMDDVTEGLDVWADRSGVRVSTTIACVDGVMLSIKEGAVIQRWKFKERSLDH